VPRGPRGTTPRREGGVSGRVTFEQLVDAGEAMLMEMVALASRTRPRN